MATDGQGRELDSGKMPSRGIREHLRSNVVIKQSGSTGTPPSVDAQFGWRAVSP